MFNAYHDEGSCLRLRIFYFYDLHADFFFGSEVQNTLIKCNVVLVTLIKCAF